MNKNLCTIPSCRNFQKYCRIHLTETFKASAPVKKESESRKELNKQYRKLAKLFITQHPRCAVRGCNRPSECVHHKAGRIGDLLLNRDYFLPVCMDHHRQIEENPSWSKEQGYSVSRLKENV